jgi:integrase/recombinase XerD
MSAKCGRSRPSPDRATAEDLRLFQLRRIGIRPPSINSSVSALRFFFTVTLGWRSRLRRQVN